MENKNKTFFLSLDNIYFSISVLNGLRWRFLFKRRTELTPWPYCKRCTSSCVCALCLTSRSVALVTIRARHRNRRACAQRQYTFARSELFRWKQ